jgi:hypothetical protein
MLRDVPRRQPQSKAGDGIATGGRAWAASARWFTSSGLIERSILVIRGQRVMLDRDLAVLYGVPTNALKQAVRRNMDRFPQDFMFVLTAQELANWRSQIVISNSDRMGLRHAPMAFTEQGVAMLSNGVVERYRDWVKVGKLDDVAGLTKDECSKITSLYKSCDDVVEAHDPSSAKNASVPDPGQLGKDIQGLRAVIDMVKARRRLKRASVSGD